MTDSVVPRPGQRWMLVGWLTIFLVGTDLFIVSPFIPVIGRELHRDPAALTWMVSLFSITYAIACPLQGRLAERVGAARVLLAGVALLALANLLTALSSTMPALLMSRALAGIAAASTSPMLYALAAEFSALNKRASNLALVNSGLLIALVLGAPAGLLMAGYSGWREVFALLALAFVLMLPINWLTWRTSIAAQPAGTRSSAVERAVSEPLSAAFIHLSSMICWSASVYAVYTLLGTALEADYRMGTYEIAGCLTCFGLGASIGSVRGGRVADRIGPAKMTTLCFAGMAMTQTLMLLVYPWHQTWALCIVLFAFALSAYGFFPALQACAVQRFPKRRPTVLGLLSSSLYVGLTIGAAAGGHLFVHVGMTGVITLALALSVGGVLLSRRLQANETLPVDPSTLERATP